MICIVLKNKWTLSNFSPNSHWWNACIFVMMIPFYQGFYPKQCLILWTFRKIFYEGPDISILLYIILLLFYHSDWCGLLSSQWAYSEFQSLSNTCRSCCCNVIPFFPCVLYGLLSPEVEVWLTISPTPPVEMK